MQNAHVNTNSIPPISQLFELFASRTWRHIHLVRNNLRLMQGYQGINLTQLESRAQDHDQSKFSKDEIEGYAYLNWRYYHASRGITVVYTPEIETLIRQSMVHHYSCNHHHPEYFAELNDIDDIDIVEMVCDWTAMSQELNLNSGSAMTWARANLDRKWKFTPPLTARIFNAINELDKRRPSLN